MKKILIAMLILGFLAVPTAHAGLISFSNLTSDDDVSYSSLNTRYNALKNELNGSVEDVNLSADTLTERVFADSSNPRVRTDENIGSYTYTGHLPATSASLTSDISAGTSYVEGYRIVTAATSHTYTASKDTWVYIDINGTFHFEEVALSGAQPTTPANSLLLAKVVTDATKIASVVDHRQTTPPNLRIYTEYRSELVVQSQDIDNIKVGAGEIEFGVGDYRRRNASETTSITWTDLDTGVEATSTLYWLWAVPDTATTTAIDFKISLSSSDVTGQTYERLIGWFYNDSSGSISQASNWNLGNSGSVPNYVTKTGFTTITASGTTYWIAMHDMTCDNWTASTYRPTKITFNAPLYNTGAAEIRCRITVNDIPKVSCDVWTQASGPAPVTLQWIGVLPDIENEINVEWQAASGTATSAPGTHGERTLIVEEL